MKNGCDCCVIIFIFIGSVRALASVLIACVWVRALHTHVLASSSELCSECICAYCSQTLVSNVCPCCSFVQRRDRACVCVCLWVCAFVCVCVCVVFMSRCSTRSRHIACSVAHISVICKCLIALHLHFSEPACLSRCTYTSIIHKLITHCVRTGHCVSVTGSNLALGKRAWLGKKSEGRWSSLWLDSSSVHPFLITYGTLPGEYLPSSLPLYLLSSSLSSPPSSLFISLSLSSSCLFIPLFRTCTHHRCNRQHAACVKGPMQR